MGLVQLDRSFLVCDQDVKRLFRSRVRKDDQRSRNYEY